MFKRLFAIMIAIMFFATPVIAFDQSPGTFPEFKNWVKGSTDVTPVLSDGWVEITTIGHAEGLYVSEDSFRPPDFRLKLKRGIGLFATGGSGYHLGNGWIVTNAHVVHPHQVAIQINSAFTYITNIDRIVSINYMIGSSIFGSMKGTLFWIDEERDLALLYVDPITAPMLKDYGYRTTWTVTMYQDKIEKDDAVAIIARVRDKSGDKLWHYEVRYGKVIANKPVLPPGISNDFLPWFNLNDITLDLPLYPGDSGSPIFAFDNGRPVIIGLGRATAGVYGSKTYSYMTRIDPIHIKSFESK